MNDKENIIPFSEDYWRQEGGQKWVESIDDTESTLHAFNEELLEHAEISIGETVLDVGCGGGLSSIEIAKRVGQGGRVVGIDISPDVLAIAGERGKHIPNLEFTEGDAASQPLPPDSFNLIFSRFGVMFFSQPANAFNNLRQALKADGRMVFLCWRTLEENPWMMEPAQAAFTVIPREGPPPDPDAPGPFSLGSRGRVEELLGGAGFQALDIQAVDAGMSIGPLDDAVEFFMKMGPAAAVVQEASEAQKSAVREALEKVLKNYATADGVVMPGAAWLVAAR